MKVDVTSMFFNSKIVGGTATAAWGTSIGQNASKECRIEYQKIGVVDMVIGMTYKSVSDLSKLDVSAGSAEREILCCSVFNDIYINRQKIDGAQYVLLLVREHSKSHDGRLLITYAPYIKYNNIPNSDCIDLMRQKLGCMSDGCWFVYEINIENQSELHFFAKIVDANAPKVYYTSQMRSDEWKGLLSSNIPLIPFSISHIIDDISSTGLLYDDVLIKRFAFSLMSKQFLILSGLAGSGKTQLAIAFASALIEDDSQMCIVPVGADWTNREPLLGFPNALKEGEYVKPDNGVLDLLINASMPENASKPFFLILDEMNMSYVERYFADFLSAMESHKEIPLWGGGKDNVPSSVALPKNLFIIGTINVDETTYMFSPKVLDRANVIEFKISDEEMDSFLNNMNPIDRDSILYKDAGMGASFVELAGKDELAGDGAIKETLSTFFRNLKSVNAEFGYRSATEIYRFVWQAQNNDDCTDDEKMKIDEILDCAIVQKLLPKLHGSRKKLEPVLQALWKECFDKDKKDFVMSRDNVQKAKYPLTADKIQRMHDAAQTNGFTSFAEA